MPYPLNHSHSLGEMFIARRADLRAVAAGIVGHSELVDDVLQDAYLKLAYGVCVRDVEKPYNYCCQVVRNMAFDYCRRRVTESACIVQSEDGELPEVEGGHVPEAGLDERRILSWIEAALEQLPERTRLVFELYRLQGRTQREIAGIIGVSASLVNILIKDAVGALSRCRKDYDG
ncbi:sigma-70 family RNA polymerase sigma factor [Thauera sinica]|uniref:Sigma-70 family RNA polymerase sigma factor n=1 Tax=Thauera sinica TaxID=2665146 RepID=A0ABW1AME6_9RHOO|nr:sigma-70 family RNA polymerase sigma factor [Thauera sp. K11]ATE59255.1 RNA polymerase subunit sigma-70 [Thauera sp. K11]